MSDGKISLVVVSLALVGLAMEGAVLWALGVFG